MVSFLDLARPISSTNLGQQALLPILYFVLCGGVALLFGSTYQNCWELDYAVDEPLARDTVEGLKARLNCFAHRFSYDCASTEYDAWLRHHAPEFVHIETLVEEKPLRGDVLFIGNSFVGQMCEAMICAYRDSIVTFAGTNLYNGCLEMYNASEPCNGYGQLNHCGVYLAQATLSTGARIHCANNHPWLFGGEQRLTRALDHMHVRVSDLRTIVLGNWNPQAWAMDQFATGSRDKEGKYPIPRLTNEHEYYRCGGGFDVSNRALIENMTTPYSPQAFMDYLSSRGFRGNLFLGTAGQKAEVPVRRGYVNTFEVHEFPYRAQCLVPRCNALDGHSCMPGEPFLQLTHLLSLQ